MNARQKAKKLKKELELIKTRAPKITVYNTYINKEMEDVE